MAEAQRKIDPAFKPISDELNRSWEGHTHKISSALEKVLGGSGVSGRGFRQVNEEIKDISNQMLTVFGNNLLDDEAMVDFLALNLLQAANENLETTNLEEALKNSLQAANDNEESDTPPLPAELPAPEDIINNFANGANTDTSTLPNNVIPSKSKKQTTPPESAQNDEEKEPTKNTETANQSNSRSPNNNLLILS